MEDYDLAVKIKEILNNDRNQGLAELPIRILVNIWFKGRNDLTDLIFTKKIIEFTEQYNFGYISILDHRNRVQAIRFWEKEKVKELGEGNAIHNART